MNNDTTSILVAGVGGQGTILAAKVLSEAAALAGYDVKMSEIHGMSQRGGSVTSHVRWGSSVASPVIELGCADILMAFEILEAARYIPYVRPGGIVLINELTLYPLPVLSGAADYPDDLIAQLREVDAEVLCIPAAEIAHTIGDMRVQNMVLMGALSRLPHLATLDFDRSMRATIKERLLEINLAAFTAGKEFIWNR